MDIRKLLLLVLFATLGMQAQTTNIQGNVNFVKNPVAVTDTIGNQVLLRKTSDGRMVKINWSTLVGIVASAGGAPNLSAVLSVGNTANNSIYLQDGVRSLQYQKTGQAYTKGGFTETIDYIDPVATVKYSWPAKTAPDVIAMISDIENATAGFIPLSGTETGVPITGDLEFSDERFVYSKNDDYNVGVSLNPTGDASLYLVDFATEYRRSFITSTLGLKISDNDPLSKGLTGAQDFTSNVTDLDYVQKKYVDDAITAAGGTPNLQSVTAVGNTTTTGINLLQSVTNIGYFKNTGGESLLRVGNSFGDSYRTDITSYEIKSGGKVWVQSSVNQGLYGVLNADGITGGSKTFNMPNTAGTLAISASVNGGTVSQADANGNINLTVPLSTGTVTSVTGDTTGGLTVTNPTTTPTLTMSTASGTQRGTTKLYNNVTGTNTDGAPDQASVNAALALKAPLASPALTGTPTAPTATAGTSTTQIATTAYADNSVTNYNIQQPVVTPIEVSHTFVKETKLRRKNVDWSGLYTGTVRTVGTGGTYATITAAVSAANSGDIIQILDGTYAMESESGGYYNHVNITKNLVIQGNASNNGAVILQQTTSTNPYCFRIQRSVNLTVKNLTIQTNQSNAAVSFNTNTASSGTNVIFDNCVMKCTGTGNNRTINIQGISSNTNYIELKNCDVYANGTTGSLATTIGFESQVTDSQQASFPTYILITGGRMYGWMNWENGCNDVSMYDVYCEQSQYASGVIFRYGKDTETPFSTNSRLDVRGCSFKYTGSFQGHGVLLGRGTKFVYFANNHVFVPRGNPDSGLALGIVVKSTATTVGDVLIEGNAVIAPRPLYIKGGQNNIMRYNTCEATWSGNDTGAGWEINNPNNVGEGGALTSQGNVITYNKFIGKAAGGITTTASGATDAFLSAQASTIDYNTYQVKNSNTLYFFKESIATFTNWTDRATLWGNSNDSHSNWLTYYAPTSIVYVNESERTVTVSGQLYVPNGTTSTSAVNLSQLQANVSKANNSNITATTTVTTSQFGTNGILYLTVNATSAPVTVNLPAASTWVGYTLRIIKTDSSGNGITIDANGSELINQNLTYPITTQNDNAGFYSDGTTIRVIN